MTGIPSAGGAHHASRAVVRTLIRCALLTGMVVGGWLLGSATGLAQQTVPGQENPFPQDQTRQGESPAGPANALFTAVTPVEVPLEDLRPVIEAPRLPTRQPPEPPAPQPGLRQPVPVPVPALLEPVPDPAMALVLDVVQPEPADTPPAPLPAVAPDLVESTGPAEPTEVASATTAPPLAPVTRSGETAQAEPAQARTTAQVPTGDRLTRSSGAVGEPASPLPGSLPTTPLPTSCATSSASSTATTGNAHAVTLHEGCAAANLILLQHRMSRQADGVPGAPSRRPSTSPD